MPHNNKEVKRLEKALHDKLRLHVEAEMQKQNSLIREQVLCDLLVHQDVFERILSAAAKVDGREASQLHAVLLEQLNAAVEGPWQQQPALPCSYVAQLLRQSTVDQVQQVLSMSAQEWAEYWAGLAPQFLMQLELCGRSSHDESNFCESTASDSPSSSSAQGAGSGSSCPKHKHSSGAPDSGWLHQHFVQIQQLVDDIVHMLHLGCLLNHIPAIEGVSRRLDSGSGGPPDLQHWEQVADRIQLTNAQAEQISVMHQEFQRRCQGQSLQGKRLIEDTEQSGLQLAAALQHPPQQQQQSDEAAGGLHSRHLALPDAQHPPLPQQQQQQQQQRIEGVVTSDQGNEFYNSSQEAMLATLEQEGSSPWNERLEQQLQTYMRKRLVLHQCMQAFIANTLSTYQIAMLIIASYPWVPSANLVAGIVAKRVQERHQQQVNGVVQQQRYTATAGAGDSSDSGAGGSAGLQQARAGGADGATKAGKGERGGKIVAFGQWRTRQREKARAQELALHQRACWAQLGCELPGQEQPLPQPRATQQQQQQHAVV